MEEGCVEKLFQPYYPLLPPEDQPNRLTRRLDLTSLRGERVDIIVFFEGEDEPKPFIEWNLAAMGRERSIDFKLNAYPYDFLRGTGIPTGPPRRPK